MPAQGGRRAAGMALVAGGTLLAEVSLTRVLSVSLYHHFAFLVVSTALLGTGVAGAYLSASQRFEALDSDDVAAVGALILAIGLPVCFTLVQFIAFEPMLLAAGGKQLIALGLMYLLYAVPFFGGGLAIAATLDRHVADAPRLYAADLVGASVGAFLALAALPALGGIGAVVFGAALAALAGVMFGRGRLRLAAGASALLLVLFAPFADGVLPLHIASSKVTRGQRPFAEALKDPSFVRATRWNTMARIDHVVFSDGVERLMIDAGVAAVRIPNDAAPVASDATLPYELRPDARVLVIGAGAGWEVEEALAFGAAHVDAVEVNPIIAAYLPPRLARDPRVHWIVDEGRSFIERSTDRYDAIIMFHTISNAATSAGAMHLAEDYLLTQEAITALVEHLTDDGFLCITRPESQIPRLLASLPRDVFVYGWAEKSAVLSFYGALLVTKQKPSVEDTRRIIERIGSRTRLRMLFTPEQKPTDPVLAGILAGEDLGELEHLAGGRLDPATDDRPFFHQRRRFGALTLADLRGALGSSANARLEIENQPFTEIAAVLLLVETTLIGLLVLGLPLFFSRSGARRIPVRRRVATLVYFIALGLGFMLVEIALVQRLGLLLGAPALAFATVFGGLLFGAGLGSRFSARLRHPVRTPIYAAAMTAALAIVLPFVLRAGAAGAEPTRIAVALLVVLPAGFVLGMPFPSGLVRIGAEPRGLVAWAFSANGIASIAGTVLALIGASAFGFTQVMLIGAVVYGVAYVAGRAL